LRSRLARSLPSVFEHLERATQLTHEEKLTGLELLFSYGAPRCDLVVPLMDGA
jgi:hypothetical protein